MFLRDTGKKTGDRVGGGRETGEGGREKMQNISNLYLNY